MAQWTLPPVLSDEIQKPTRFPIYSADALSSEARAPTGEMPLLFYWYRRAVYNVKTSGTV